MAMAVLSWTSWPNLKEAPLLSLRQIKGTFLDRAKLGRCFDSHRGLQSEAIRTAWSPMYVALVRFEAKLGANGVNGGVVGAIGVTGGMRSRTRVTSFTPIANCCYKNIQKKSISLLWMIKHEHVIKHTYMVWSESNYTNLEPHLFG